MICVLAPHRNRRFEVINNLESLTAARAAGEIADQLDSLLAQD